MGMENKNFVLAIVLSLAIVFAFQWLLPPPKKPAVPPQQQATQGSVNTDLPNPAAAAPSALEARADALAVSKRVMVETPLLKGSINLAGGRLDDLTLLAYHETIDPSSPAIVLLSPSGTAHAYLAEGGWIGPGEMALPNGQTVWTADGEKLSIDHPVTLSWSNGSGLAFKRVISIDDAYMFTVRDEVSNSSTAAVKLRPYALVSRSGKPPVSSTWISYEGPIGAFSGVEEDVKYSAIPLDAPVTRDSSGGWLGFSDKYWLSAVAPLNQAEPLTATFHHSGVDDGQKFQADYLGPEIEIPAGGTASHGTLIFAGAKEVKRLARYEETLGLARFDNAVDFGWFKFFTKPIFYVLDWIYAALGNFGLAILSLTVIMRLIFFPLQTRAVMSMNKMKVLQPQVARLREQYADDKVKLNQETMELYRKSGANPLAGCLPVVVQIPVFFSLYKVLYVTIEMRHAPFFGWIRDLSAPDPTNIWNLFGLVPWVPPHILPAIGIWPLIYCASMFIQTRLGPQSPDPVQAKMMQFMPLMFTFMMAGFPAGLVIYWSWSNVLLILQQYIITHHVAPVPAKA